MVVSHVMRKRGLTHEQYRRIQIDIDHVLSLVRRAWRYGRSAITVFEQQDRVSALLTIPSFLEEEGHGSKVNHYLTFKREIRVSGIQFAYPNVSENALDFTDGPCDITFEPGKVYGVVGQNRSGKSTLMHLVCKLHKPSAGTISLDGIPYDQVSRIALRNLIAYVPQRAFLFAGSIADNIRMGYELATDDEVYEAARMAGVFAYAEFSKPSDVSSSASGSSSTAPSASVSAVDESTQAPARSRTPTSDNESEHDSPTSGSDSDLPASPEETRAHERAVLEMVVQPRGHNLSGGFAQSVALARAFLRKDARIVVLDESMSAMDPFKKRVVIIPQMMQHIRARGLTLIMVSHEMQQVRDLCDCIYVLENGRLCCCGTHRDMLLNRSEAYMRLVGDVPAEAVEAPNSLVRPTEVLEYSV
jgi:ABC-type multidrug transport system fused ATPase/permease subunit